MTTRHEATGSHGRGEVRNRNGVATLGIVGAGQLARMTCEAASALGIRTVVLAADREDAAAGVASALVLGAPSDRRALDELVSRCSVVTFDHEQVDLEVIGALEARGVVVRPGTRTLEIAVDKATMRTRLQQAGVAVPSFEILAGTEPDESVEERTARFGDAHGWPLVCKAARGGYDGKGVWPVQNVQEAARVRHRTSGHHVVMEAHVDIDAELAVLVARRPGGDMVSWPAVQTAQAGGVCREVLVPTALDPGLLARAESLAKDVAAVAEATGVLAVELFCSNGELSVNEIAARPHNSGHWTIEGSQTSQFENHVRAVLDLPLGTTALVAPEVASVNVFGGDHIGPDALLAEALKVRGAHVHLYGKAARPGRKLGHVTVLGKDASDVRARAWAAAGALGTPQVPDIEQAS